MEESIWKHDFRALEKFREIIQKRIEDIKDKEDLKKIYETYLDLVMYSYQQEEVKRHRNQHEKRHKLLN